MADLTKQMNDEILARARASGLDLSKLTYKQILEYINDPSSQNLGDPSYNPEDVHDTPYNSYWTPQGIFQGNDASGYRYNTGEANTKNENKWNTYLPDGTVSENWLQNVRDGGMLSKNFENIVKTGIGLMAGGAAGLYGGAAGAGAGGVGALEAGATMFPGEVAGFGYGGLGSTGAGLGIAEGATMFPGEAAGFGYSGAGSAGSGLGLAEGATMFPGEATGFGYSGAEGALSGLPGGASAPAGAGGGASGSGMLGKLGDIAGSKIGSALIGGALGGLGGSGDKELTQTQQSNIDPRMASILYGADGKSGFINDILTAGKGGLKGGLGSFGQYSDDYLGTYGLRDLEGMRGAAGQLMSGNIDAPQMKGANPVQASLMGAAQINAPSQNNTDLSAAYQDMIYGQPGNNPYLTGGIQKGINQANTAFQNMQTDATRNLTENILPSIRSGAQVNGQYGGSRQALSEGKALNDYSTQIGRAMSQVGQNNTDSAIAARAGAYNTDRNNALSAMSGLGAQQYGVATNNAQLQQQANAQNANFLNDASRTNAGLQQQTQQSNLQSQIGTNSLNSANKATGINAQSGLLGQAYNYGTNNDMYNLNKIGKTSGMLGQYTGLGGSSTSSQPLYENKMGNILGGATAGLGLYNAYKDLFKN